MKTLHLLRHAKSDWDGSWDTDRERPLNPRGRTAAPMIGAHMVEQDLEPDLVLCSSATRTIETLELLGDGVPSSAEVRILDQLYGAEPLTILAELREAPDSAGSVLVIAHNPGIHRLAVELAGPAAAGTELIGKYPTAALASFKLETGEWAEAGAAPSTLVSFIKPRDLQPS